MPVSQQRRAARRPPRAAPTRARPAASRARRNCASSTASTASSPNASTPRELAEGVCCWAAVLAAELERVALGQRQIPRGGARRRARPSRDRDPRGRRSGSTTGRRFSRTQRARRGDRLGVGDGADRASRRRRREERQARAPRPVEAHGVGVADAHADARGRGGGSIDATTPRSAASRSALTSAAVMPERAPPAPDRRGTAARARRPRSPGRDRPGRARPAMRRDRLRRLRAQRRVVVAEQLHLDRAAACPTRSLSTSCRTCTNSTRASGTSCSMRRARVGDDLVGRPVARADAGLSRTMMSPRLTSVAAAGPSSAPVRRE